jgi:hypothetical protein
MFVYRTYSMEDCSAMHGCSALLQFEPGMFYDKDYFKRLHEFPSLRFLCLVFVKDLKVYLIAFFSIAFNFYTFLFILSFF